MSDPRSKLQSLFSETNRFANFGNAIVEINVEGIRCHKNTKITITNPITAFCGLNGTGKSTLLQLSATAYRPTDQSPYNISDFVVINQLDPNPVDILAKVEFKIWRDNVPPGILRLRRSIHSSRWRGYSRRRTRNVFFAGIGMYLPRCEQPSFITRAPRLKVVNSAEVVGRVREWTCRILGRSYDQLFDHKLSVSDRRGGRISSVKKGSIGYSEAHMGFGEARTIHIVATIETLPEKSLVLLEEPETSLHPAAQHEFGRYLVDVCVNKRHQILLTTHSEFILQALPSPSRIYLEHTDHGIRAIPGLTAVEARSLMALGHSRALTILVEDPCAKAVLAEIVRRHDPAFLKTLAICVGGDCDRVRNTVLALKETDLNVVAVRDADKPDTPRENIFRLPGTQPPEKEIFAAESVATHISNEHKIELTDFRVELADVDHHHWIERFADRIQRDPSAVTSELAQAYVRGLPESQTSTLVTLLKEATRK